MAEAKSASSSLSDGFNKVANHLFSPTMIIMMALMALPMVGAAAAAAGAKATVGDIALGTVDMFWQMISAPFTDGGVVADAAGNLIDGNIAPGSYEMGAMDHGAAHSMPGDLTGKFEHWKNAMSPEQWSETLGNAESYGMTPEQYFQNLPEAHR